MESQSGTTERVTLSLFRLEGEKLKGVGADEGGWLWWWRTFDGYRRKWQHWRADLGKGVRIMDCRPWWSSNCRWSGHRLWQWEVLGRWWGTQNRGYRSDEVIIVSGSKVGGCEERGRPPMVRGPTLGSLITKCLDSLYVCFLNLFLLVFWDFSKEMRSWG